MHARNHRPDTEILRASGRQRGTRDKQRHRESGAETPRSSEGSSAAARQERTGANRIGRSDCYREPGGLGRAARLVDKRSGVGCNWGSGRRDAAGAPSLPRSATRLVPRGVHADIFPSPIRAFMSSGSGAQKRTYKSWFSHCGSRHAGRRSYLAEPTALNIVWHVLMWRFRRRWSILVVRRPSAEAESSLWGLLHSGVVGVSSRCAGGPRRPRPSIEMLHFPYEDLPWYESALHPPHPNWNRCVLAAVWRGIDGCIRPDAGAG